jgi:oleandomycin transport system ATP-binding protein
MTYAIQAEKLAKSFGKTQALVGVDLAARSGTVLGVLGPNGAGKTTTVRILATQIVPDSGRAHVGGYDVVRHAQAVRQLTGLTGQYASVDEALTGVENLVLIGRLLGMPRHRARSRAAELLERFSLSDAAGRPAGTYSGGMRRRLDLAASLVGEPQILFLDEPTTGLDPRSRLELWGIVRDLVANGVTVLLTTQYLEEADELANDIVVINHGRVIAAGTPAELKAAVGGQRLQVRPVRATDLDRVARTLGRLAGAWPDVNDGLVTVPVTDPALVGGVVREMDVLNVPLSEISLRQSTLDEVFLALTGEPAGDPAEAADERNVA